MKVIMAIIEEHNEHNLTQQLTEKGFMVTKIATSGGFLKKKNSTLLIGVEEEKVEDVIHVINSECKTKAKIASTMSDAKVAIGGATVFVIDVEKFKKI